MFRELGRMIRRPTDQVADASLLDLVARAAKTLARIIEPQLSADPTADLVVSLSQGKLAELAGGSRQSVNGALATLVSRNLIRIDGRKIVVIDVPGLHARAGVAPQAPPDEMGTTAVGRGRGWLAIAGGAERPRGQSPGTASGSVGRRIPPQTTDPLKRWQQGARSGPRRLYLEAYNRIKIA
jgi:Crp-like helix-turn-helix domain